MGAQPGRCDGRRPVPSGVRSGGMGKSRQSSSTFHRVVGRRGGSRGAGGQDRKPEQEDREQDAVRT